MIVEEIMIKDISAVYEDDSVERFVRISSNHQRSGMPVVDGDLRLVGFISENDIVNAVMPSYFGMLQSASFIPDTNQLKRKLREIRKEPIKKFMIQSITTVQENDTLLHAADLLIRHKFLSLPVVSSDGTLLGIVNRMQILRGVIDEIRSEEGNATAS